MKLKATGDSEASTAAGDIDRRERLVRPDSHKLDAAPDRADTRKAAAKPRFAVDRHNHGDLGDRRTRSVARRTRF